MQTLTQYNFLIRLDYFALSISIISFYSLPTRIPEWKRLKLVAGRVLYLYKTTLSESSFIIFKITFLIAREYFVYKYWKQINNSTHINICTHTITYTQFETKRVKKLFKKTYSLFHINCYLIQNSCNDTNLFSRNRKSVLTGSHLVAAIDIHFG